MIFPTGVHQLVTDMIAGTQMPRLETPRWHGECELLPIARPRVNVNDPPAFIIHEVKNAVGHVKKNATAWKIAMKKERRSFFGFWMVHDGP